MHELTEVTETLSYVYTEKDLTIKEQFHLLEQPASNFAIFCQYVDDDSVFSLRLLSGFVFLPSSCGIPFHFRPVVFNFTFVPGFHLPRLGAVHMLRDRGGRSP